MLPRTSDSPDVWHRATAAQEGLWILDRVERLKPAYLIPTVLELTGPVDHDRLTAAVRLALGRHPALRSVFRLDLRRRQVVYRTDGTAPPVTFTDRPAGGWDPAALAAHVLERCYAPFDLAAQAPARAEVVRVDGTTTLLLLVVHHIVFDGWSRRLVVADIAAGYQAALRGEEPVLPRPGHPADLPEPAEADLAARVAAVTDRLRDAPLGAPLPYDRLPVGESPLVSGIAAVGLDAGSTGRLLAAAAREGCTAFMAGVALLAATLARSSAQRDFLLGVVWPGRDDPAAHGVVGMLMNTVLLRVRLGESTTWRELLRTVRAASIDAFVDGDVPLAPVAAELAPDRDVSRPPLTPVLINLAEVPGDVELAPGVTGRYRPLDVTYSIWDLILFVHVDHDPVGAARLELTADYATDLFDRGTVTSLLAALRRCALDLTTNLEDPVLDPATEIDLTDPAARLELVRSVWQDILGTDDLADDIGFFDAGGNSLLVVALVEELSRAAGRPLRTMDVFRAGTIAGQAELLARAGEPVDNASR